MDRFRNVTGELSKNGNLVKEVMEEEWDVLRREENNHLSSDSLQYNPFAILPKVLHMFSSIHTVNSVGILDKYVVNMSATEGWQKKSPPSKMAYLVYNDCKC